MDQANRTRHPRRRLLMAVGAAGGVVLLAVVVLLLSLPAVLRWAVVSAARARGVDLVVTHVDPGWGWVRLRDADVSLQGVDGVHAKLARATVDLLGLSPTRVEVSGLAVSIRGSAADVMIEAATFAKVHGEALRFPVVAEAVDVDWREHASDAPWLTVKGALIAPSANGVRLTAQLASVLDVKAGPVGASWSSDRLSASLGFGQPDPDKALVRVDVPRGLEGKEATVTLQPMRLADVQRPLGVTMPISADAMVSGQAKLGLAPDAHGAIAGSVHLSLRGWVPPHPRELDGIVFGNETTFDTAFSIDGSRKQVKLSDSVVRAGAFVLEGGGQIDRQGDHASIAMDMSGAIPCQALAKSAVGAHVPGAVGQLIGDVVQGALTGSVTVTVSVRADTRALTGAAVRHTVGVGCGLRL